MVGELYDYMLGIVIVGIIFISAVVTIPAISYVNFQQIDQQQLRNTALNLFNAMLLGPGSPVDWGSTFPFNQDEVEAFGLAHSGESSLYKLDIDKLQRLDNTSAGFIEYEKVKELLGLEGYGFRLEIFRPFMVNWDIRISNNQVLYSVIVTRNLDQRPIQNAEVSVTTLCAAGNPDKVDDPVVRANGPSLSYTNALGKSDGIEVFSIPPGYDIQSAIAVIKVTVSDISTMAVATTDRYSQTVMKINTFGDNIVLTVREEEKNTSAARIVQNIHTFNFDEELSQIWDGGSDNNEGKITEGYGYLSWNKTFPGLRTLDPGLLLFTVSATFGPGEGGRKTVIVAGPFSFWESSKVLSFGSLGPPVNARVKLRRFAVDFSGMTYIAELLLWEE